MDRLIYTAASGAKHIMEQQATASHNLANVTTTGFRAQIDSFRAVPVQSDGLPTRAFVVNSTVGADFSSGPLQMAGRAPPRTRACGVNSTVGADFSSGPLQMPGRDLDVAIKGKGWLALQMPDGT